MSNSSTAIADDPAIASANRPWARQISATVLRHPLMFTFLIALAVRLALVATSSLFEGFVLDDGTYQVMATAMADGDISHWDEFTYSLFWRTAAFLGPVTALYKLFGPDIVVGQIYVAFVGATVVAAGTRLALEFLSARWAIAVGMVLALLPSQAFWSAQLMKDASVWLALITLALLVAIANRSTGWHLLMAGIAVAAALCALAFLREHTLVIAAWGTMIGSVAGISQLRVQRVIGAVVLGVAIPWFVAASGPAGLDLVMNAGSLEQLRFNMAQGANTAIVDTTPGGTESELDQVVAEKTRILQEIEELNAASEAPASEAPASEAPASEAPASEAPASEGEPKKDAAIKKKIRQLEDRAEKLAAKEQMIRQPPPPPPALSEDAPLAPDVAHLPRGLSVMLLEPFPIPFTGSASLRLARLESLVWYPLVGLAAVGLWVSRRHLRQMLFPLMTGGGILVMYALSEGNIGTAHRHRGEFVWVVVLLAGLGAAHLWHNKQVRETRAEAKKKTA